MYKELKQNQPNNVEDKKIRAFVNNIRRFLKNVEGEYKTNQEAIGIKNIFRGIKIKVWKEINFRTIKYTDLNRIINKYCMNYCVKCWKDRNKKLHDLGE